MSDSLFDDRDLEILKYLTSATNQDPALCNLSNTNCASSCSPMQLQISYPASAAYGNPQSGCSECLPAVPTQMTQQHHRQSHQALAKTIQYKKPKRVRTAFTTDQLLALENEFSVRNYVTPAQRALISRNLKINEKHIKTWFQNRRMRQKKMSTGSDSSSIISDNEFGVSSTISDQQHSNNVSEMFERNISPNYFIPDNNISNDSHQIQPESYPNRSVGQNQWCNPLYEYNGYNPCVLDDSVTSSMQVQEVSSNNNDLFSCNDPERYPNSSFGQNQWCNNPVYGYNGYNPCVMGDSVTSSMQVQEVSSNNNFPFSCNDSELLQYCSL